MKALGRHLLVEYSGCDREILDDVECIQRLIEEAAVEAGATIVQSVFHRFNPFGVSGVVVIAESHLAIHTWPEYGYAAVDLFTCGTQVDPWKSHGFLREALGATSIETNEVPRGLVGPGTPGVVPFKPHAVPVAV